MTLFRWFIIRQVRRERLRSAVTVAGVAVGIAVVVAIQLANESSVRGFSTALDAISGQVSLEVSSPGIGVAEDRLGDLHWLREYGKVSPIMDADVLMRLSGSDESVIELMQILGVDILSDRPFRDYQLVGDADDRSQSSVTTQEFLALLTDSQAVVLTKVFADRHRLGIGDSVELIVGDQTVPLIIHGLLDDKGPAQVLDGNFALMDLAAAQLALRRLGAVDRVDIQLHDKESLERAQIEIANRLPQGLSVQRPERRGAQVEKMLAAFHFNLTALSYIALLVGVFLIYNTITVSVITRRSEIGMLRTVGASRLTILQLFLGEAVGLAVVGCVIGAPFGWVLAQVAVGLTASTVSTFWVAAAATVPPLTVGYLVVAFSIGIPLALGAAFIPAYEAACLTPLSAVRSERELIVRSEIPIWYLVGAFALFAASGLCALQPSVSGLPLFGLAAALGVVFGGALLVPVVLSSLQWVRGLDCWLGVEVTLARANLGGSIRRVSVSVAALVVSFAMMVAIIIMIGSFRETVIYWVGQTLQADLFVSAARQSPIGDRSGVSSEVENEIMAHPGVVAIDGFRSVDVPYGGSLIIVGSGRFDVLLTHGNLLFKAPGDGHAAIAKAGGEETVVVSESFALKYDVQVGSWIELPTRSGLRSFQVVAVYFDYSSDRGIVVMDEALFDEHYDHRRPFALSVYLAEGVDPGGLRDSIRSSLGSKGRVFVNTNSALRAQVLEVFDSTFAITYALEGIAIFVSMFGVAATLLTLALERRKDIAMLRLIGAERRHLRRVVMIEAILLGMVSLGLGLVVGLALSLILIFVINLQSFGWTIQLHLPVMFLIQSSLLILVAATVAGLYPARLAGQFTLADLREK